MYKVTKFVSGSIRQTEQTFDLFAQNAPSSSRARQGSGL